MNIAIVPGIFFPHPGGVQVQIHNVSNKLVEKKNDVDCYLLEKTNIKNNKYNIHVLNTLLTSVIFIFHYYFRIDLIFLLKFYFKRIIQNKKYSIWHFHFINYKSLIILNCLSSLNQKIIVTFHGIDIQIDKEINYGYRLDKKFDKYLRSSIKNIDHFTSISNTIKQDLIKLGVNEKKITEIPNGLDLKKFTLDNKNFEQNKTINLITVARFEEKKKGYDMLPILSQKMIDKNIDFKWSIIGKNTHILKKNKIINNNPKFFEIIDNIFTNDEEYFPSIDLVKKYINSDLYVNLSRVESFGIVFIESMAAKTPVITFNKKGANELIQNDVNGFIIKEDNLDIMVEKINAIWKDFSLIKSVKSKTFETAQKYDLNLVTNKFLNIYSLKGNN